MPNLAALGAHHRLHTLRPLPPRLEREPGSTRTSDPHHVHPRLLRSASLVRRIEVQQLHTSHLNPSRRPYDATVQRLGALRSILATDTDAEPFGVDEFLRRVADREGVAADIHRGRRDRARSDGA